MQEREKIKQLFERYRAGRCTPEEQARLHEWFNRYAGHEASGLEDLKAIFEAEQAATRRRGFGWLPYAAAVLLVAILAGYFAVVNRQSIVESTSVADILPGGNRAILTLADGRTVDLSEAQAGIIIGNGITYLDGSTVLSETVSTGDREEPHKLTPSQTHTLTTPKGGTYQITLPDGTKVWLNAASTLTYPQRFASDKRIVEIEGEGYFSVARDVKRPFCVISRGQEIEVLGTEFNVSAYADDSVVKTTLVEGSVRLRTGDASEILLSGEQAVLANNYINKKEVDIAPYVAWKNGDFYFDNTPLIDMMKEISRWYSVEVIYETGIPQEYFSGGMSRNVSLQTVLKLLRISEVKYRIEKSRLIIQ